MNAHMRPRRRFLSDLGTGFGSLALGAMLQRDGSGAESNWSPPDGLAHFAPKAKSVIWLFMAGGVSQVETFDPKPELTKHGGKTIPDTPFGSVLESPYIKNRVELVKGDANGKIYDKLYPLQVGHKKRGECGVEVSDWLPHLSECVDDMSIIRSMWTTASNHDAQLQFHTGRNRFDGFFPTIGAWVHYGLGSLNDNLPQFVVMGQPIADCCVIQASILIFNGVVCAVRIGILQPGIQRVGEKRFKFIRQAVLVNIARYLDPCRGNAGSLGLDGGAAAKIMALDGDGAVIRIGREKRIIIACDIVFCLGTVVSVFSWFLRCITIP